MSVAHRHDQEPDSTWPELRRVARARLEDPRVRRALTSGHAINQEFDIAYIAGISTDLKTLYVDRHFPLHAYMPEKIDVSDELWLHECGEATFILLYGDHYLRAHDLITVMEHDVVVSRGINWTKYTELFDLYDKQDEHEQIMRSPPDLFLRPYEDSRDYKLLAKIRETMTWGT